MALKDMDMTAVLRRLADRRIEEAMKEGKFDNLSCQGQDIVLDDIPAEENARLAWWCLRILKNNDFVPDEVKWRKGIDQLKDAISRATDEKQVILLVEQVNRLVKQLNTLGTNAINIAVKPIDLDEELARLRVRTGAEGSLRDRAIGH